MITQLQLANIRNVLIRLEETIIFGLIERSQFLQNLIIYEPGALGSKLGQESLMDYLLHEGERSHAKVRRYTSPDEEPFFNDLPAPVLPLLDFSDSPLIANTINFTPQIKQLYIQHIVPLICKPGDDKQYGSSAINDVTLLQAIAKRIHYGKFVAECKYRDNPSCFQSAINAADTSALMKHITNTQVEQNVLDRVYNKTKIFSGELDSLPDVYCLPPETARTIYKEWIIPLNKEVQVNYLLLHTENV